MSHLEKIAGKIVEGSRTGGISLTPRDDHLLITLAKKPHGPLALELRGLNLHSDFASKSGEYHAKFARTGSGAPFIALIEKELKNAKPVPLR